MISSSCVDISGVAILGAFIVVVGWTPQVIAAAGTIDQPPAATSTTSEANGHELGATASTISEYAAAGVQWGLSALGLALLITVFVRRWYRLKPLKVPGSMQVALVGGFGFLVVYLTGAMAGPAAAWAFNLSLPGSENVEELSMSTAATLTGATLAGQLIALTLALPRFARVQPEFGSRRSPGVAARLAVLALFVVWPIAILFSQLATLLGSLLRGQAISPIAHKTLQMLLDSQGDGWFWLMIGLVVLVAPVVEELLYRGLLQRAAVAWLHARWPGILLAAVVFTGGHAMATPPEALAPLFVLSLGFGWAYERTGRLIAPIVMHMLFNAGNVTVALLVM